MSVVVKRASQLPFAPVVALLFAGVAAVLVMATPAWMLEQSVMAAGIPSVLGAAEPPLGLTAKLLLSVIVAIAVGLVGLVAMLPLGTLLSRPRRGAFEVKPMRFRPPQTEQEPDWPVTGFARPPIFADRDLGAPFMSDEALVAAPIVREVEASDDELVLDAQFEATVPDALANLAQPAVYDSPLVSEFEPALQDLMAVPRLSNVDQTGSAMQPACAPTSENEDSIASLVMRLERGIEQRSEQLATDPFSADAALSEALGALDRLAAGAR